MEDKEQCLVVYDATRKPSLLDESWGAGAFSMWLRGRTTGMLGATSWEEIFRWLEIRSEKHGKILEVQFWGHGRPGDAVVNSKSMKDVIGHPGWAKLMCSEGLWWFRTCSTFRGEKGKKLAKDLSSLLGCRVAGHTHAIGFPFHSGLHSVAPGEEPAWPDEEGWKGKESKGSFLGRPNTIMFWRNTLPNGW